MGSWREAPGKTSQWGFLLRTLQVLAVILDWSRERTTWKSNVFENIIGQGSVLEESGLRNIIVLPWDFWPCPNATLYWLFRSMEKSSNSLAHTDGYGGMRGFPGILKPRGFPSCRAWVIGYVEDFVGLILVLSESSVSMIREIRET